MAFILHVLLFYENSLIRRKSTTDFYFRDMDLGRALADIEGAEGLEVAGNTLLHALLKGEILVA